MNTFAARLMTAYVLSLGVLPMVAIAAEPTHEPVSIEVAPQSALLIGPRSRQQLIVTGQLASGERIDVTDRATFTPEPPGSLRMEGSLATPVADGVSRLRVDLGALSTSVEVEVTQLAARQPVSFKTEVLAALTKAGCNMGACHGSPSGKGGFRLSLRGFDPLLDLRTLRSEFEGRRTNIIEPQESLILKKPLMEVPHGGGRRIHQGDAVHAVLHQWIAEGMRSDPEGSSELLRIRVLPGHRVFHDAGDRQQLIVEGTFSDGTTRDITALSVFSSSDEAVATVATGGLVSKTGRGETAILARYLDKMDTVNMTFLEDVPGFAWNDPEEVNFIDRLVNDKLRELQILPSARCRDEEFLRRVYLDATGRLPTVTETMEFLEDNRPDKRTALINRLLSSRDHATFWTLRWADVLRANSGRLTPAGVAKFRQWIYEGVLSDQPMDRFARELLTATGSVFENPAASFWKASRDPLDAAETTAQLFLGIRIQCAKCHNHPFERWTQDNYYGIGAAFARVDRKSGLRPDEEVVFLKASGDVTQPRTGATMPVHLLLQGDVDVPQEVDRREVFVDWLTDPQNPFFARAVTNRIWGHLFGHGIVDPVDDFRDSNPPSNAALLDELARQFASHGFSRRWLIGQIMNSHTYQRSSLTNDFNAHDQRYFSHAVPRLLTAEQLLDAVSQVTGVPEEFRGMPPGTRTIELLEPPTEHDFLKAFGQPQREMACECERSEDSNLSQALQMINGPTVHNKLRSDSGTIYRLMTEGRSDDEIITELYLSAVCRPPTTDERQTALAHLTASADRRLALEDIGWAVLNSREFLFQH